MRGVRNLLNKVPRYCKAGSSALQYPKCTPAGFSPPLISVFVLCGNRNPIRLTTAIVNRYITKISATFLCGCKELTTFLRSLHLLLATSLNIRTHTHVDRRCRRAFSNAHRSSNTTPARLARWTTESHSSWTHCQSLQVATSSTSPYCPGNTTSSMPR